MITSTLAGCSFALLAATQDPDAAAPVPIQARIASLAQRVDPVELERTVRDLVKFGTRHVLSSTDDPARGTGAARDYLESRFREIAQESGAGDRLSITRHSAEVAARRLRRTDLPVVNILATLRGTTDPDRYYVVGGHYDSRNSAGADGEGDAPGANDDGSGTAVVIELCRVLADQEFAGTIVFACYDGEEQGLLGSAAHAETLEAAENIHVDGMITNDIVGNTLGMDGVRRRDYLRCFSYAPRGNDSGGRSLARVATLADDTVQGLTVRLVFRGDRFGRGGDHRPFAQRGVPAVRFTEPREDYSRQHQNVTERDGKPYGDLPDFMDFEYLARVTKLNLAVLAELAAAPPAPARLRVSGARDAHDTILQWTAVPGAARYEAVWRETTEPDWTHTRSLDLVEAGGPDGSRLGTKLTGVCIDDVVIGIRAVAADGARSRVTTPPEPDALSNRPARSTGRGTQGRGR